MILTLPEHIPFQKIENEITLLHKIDLRVLRLDAFDFYAGGNKLFKLKYNLEEAEKKGFRKMLTFGGAWSNHLAAVASVNNSPLPIIAVIRGEKPKVYSDTLIYCKKRGVELHFVSREDYRRKTEEGFISELKNKFGDFYLLPEGGSNALAVKGCKEIVNYIPIDFDYVCTAVGSGGTLAGIVSSLKKHQQALGFAVLKGAEYLKEEVNELMKASGTQYSAFNISHEYHFGGYAKITPRLFVFKKEFEKQFDIPLDYVYTVKMMYGIFDLIKNKHFKQGSTVVAIHTGGLQGNRGFEKA